MKMSVKKFNSSLQIILSHLALFIVLSLTNNSAFAQSCSFDITEVARKDGISRACTVLPNGELCCNEEDRIVWDQESVVDNCPDDSNPPGGGGGGGGGGGISASPTQTRPQCISASIEKKRKCLEDALNSRNHSQSLCNILYIEGGAAVGAGGIIAAGGVTVVAGAIIAAVGGVYLAVGEVCSHGVTGDYEAKKNKCDTDQQTRDNECPQS